MEKKIHRQGAIAWLDQTSNAAEKTSMFYEKVAGWKSSPVSMGEYNDYNMLQPGTKQPVAGICHNRGENADLPSGWIAYIIVDDLERSMDACRINGGKIIAGPKVMGNGSKYCIIEDPAGAITALYYNP